MPSGVVKKFFEDKGFGFITPADGGEDVFIHIKQVSSGENLSEGDSVSFDKAWNDRKGKYNATNVSFTGSKSGGGGGGSGGKGGKGGKGGYEMREYGKGWANKGKGKGKDGKDKGKGKDGKGKKGKKGKAPSEAFAKSSGAMVESTGVKKSFDDSDEE